MVIGASGMLGNAVLRHFSRCDNVEAWGSVRSERSVSAFSAEIRKRLVVGIDAENPDSLNQLFAIVRPDAVINCVGLVKQLSESEDPLQAIPINSVLPHRLARLCSMVDARLVHISTDCVFTGDRGNYCESDSADAQDLYGRSKHMGEVDYPNAITLRTSIIGHEMSTAHGLVGWFLSQNASVKGYTRAIFSGLPTCELARVISEYVLPHDALRGVYHVSADPIAKYDLLMLVREIYAHHVEIEPDDKLVIDRSLNSGKFRHATGYRPPSWPDLIEKMKEFG